MKLVFVILIISCIYVVTKAFKELQTYIKVKRNGHLVPGTIIDYEERESIDGVTYPSVVSFKTLEGQEIIATSGISNGVKPSVGKNVWIIYQPSDPKTFFFKPSAAPGFYLCFVIGFGAMAVISALELFDLI